MSEKPLIVRAIENQTIERPPVWIMRQAGRYLSEYRKLKEQHTFLEMCRSPELALEVSLQPIRYLDVDAAIIFSDIMMPLEPMGIEVDFAPGPKIGNPISTRSDVEALNTKISSNSLSYVLDAISMLRREMDSWDGERRKKGVLGFVGAPWTLACYVTEQGIFKHFHGTEVFAKREPDTVHALLEKLAAFVGDYAQAQAEAGADVIQLFDTWAGNLSPEDYRQFALPYTQKITEQLSRAGIPTVLYVNNGSHLLADMKDAGTTAISVDWRTSLPEASKVLGDDIVLQGNLNPTDLFLSESEVIKKTTEMLESWPKDRGLIVNLGHGILPETPRENAKAFVDTVKQGWGK